MGTFSCRLKLISMNGEKSVELDALVDTDAFYTQVPSSLLEELGVDRTDSLNLQFADGRTVRHDIGYAWASLNGKRVITQVVFASEDSAALLGAYTLEGLRLVVDPVSRRLLSVEAVSA